MWSLEFSQLIIWMIVLSLSLVLKSCRNLLPDIAPTAHSTVASTQKNHSEFSIKEGTLHRFLSPVRQSLHITLSPWHWKLWYIAYLSICYHWVLWLLYGAIFEGLQTEMCEEDARVRLLFCHQLTDCTIVKSWNLAHSEWTFQDWF